MKKIPHNFSDLPPFFIKCQKMKAKYYKKLDVKKNGGDDDKSDVLLQDIASSPISEQIFVLTSDDESFRLRTADQTITIKPTYR